MATHGKLAEHDGQLPASVEYFNNLYRLLKHVLVPGLACAHDSELGTLVATSSTRISMTEPDPDEDEFIYASGQIMQEVHQAFVDFSVADTGVRYAVVVDAKLDNSIAQARFEIWLRKYDIAEAETSPLADAAIYPVLGYVSWNGTTALIDELPTAAARAAIMGITPTAREYRGPLYLRDGERVELGDAVHFGADAESDPNAITHPLNLRAYIGEALLARLGINLDLAAGDNASIVLQAALLRLKNSGATRGNLDLVNSNLTMAGVSQTMDGGTLIRSTANAYTGSTAYANMLPVDLWPKAVGYASYNLSYNWTVGCSVARRELEPTGIYDVTYSFEFEANKSSVVVIPVTDGTPPDKMKVSIGPTGFTVHFYDSDEEYYDCSFCWVVFGVHS